MFQLPDDDDEFWKEVPLDDPCFNRVVSGKENTIQEHKPPALRPVSCDLSGSASGYGQTRGPVNQQSAIVQQPELRRTSVSNKPTDSSGPPVFATNAKDVPCSGLAGGTPGQFSFRRSGTNEALHAPSPALRCSSSYNNQRLTAEVPPGIHNSGMTDVRCPVNSVVTPASRADRNIGQCTHSPTTYGSEGPRNMTGVRSSTPTASTPTFRGDRPSNTARNTLHTATTPVVGNGINTSGEYITPRRKRKFPGPAGILPQLGPGQSFDQLEGVVPPTSSSKQQTSPQDDTAMLSSQSTENMFSEASWQQLISDLGEDGTRLMNKFSIAATLLNAGKKQLLQGKAPLLFGMVEALESHGSEARVTVRDKSGKMEGTVHQDLLKQYERELQVGTVLVLKQVSILSLSARKHYLNITPSNVVMVYHQDHNRLHSLPLYGSQESLSSVLQALETRAGSLVSSTSGSVQSTPKSSTGSSACSRPGSSTGTPQLCVGAGHLVSPRLTADSMDQLLRTPVRGVRDVSVVGTTRTPCRTPTGTMSVYDRSGGQGMTPRNIVNQQTLPYNNPLKPQRDKAVATTSAISSRVGGSSCVNESNARNQRFVSRLTSTVASGVDKPSVQSVVMQSDSVGLQGQWRLQPRTPVRADVSATSNNHARSCHIGNSVTSNILTSSPDPARFLCTNDNISGMDSNGNVKLDAGVSSLKSNMQNASNHHGVLSGHQTVDDQDLWDDDITDEILSQL